MLRILLLLAALTFTKAIAEDGTALVTSYMRVNWGLAKANYDQKASANANIWRCGGSTLVHNYEALISTTSDFLSASLDYAATVKASGKALDQKILSDSLATFNALFIATIPTKVCSNTYPISQPTTDQINALFDLSRLQFAALTPTGIRRPQPRAAFVRASPGFDFLGRRLVP